MQPDNTIEQMLDTETRERLEEAAEESEDEKRRQRRESTRYGDRIEGDV